MTGVGRLSGSWGARPACGQDSSAPARGTRLVDLRELRGTDLLPVLTEETAYWRSRFRWDLAPAMEAVRRMVDQRALGGWAAVSAGRPTGYCYFAASGGTATVGDLFVRRGGDDSRRTERMLLESTINTALLRPGVKRVQGQLVALTALPSLRLALAGTLRTFPRELLLSEDLGLSCARSPGPDGLQVCRWSDRHTQSAAELIAAAYRGHVDSFVNQLYGSAEGARTLLRQLTGGLGSTWFFPPASAVARASGKASLAGLTIGGMVGEKVGHVLQLCVAPQAQGRGLGSKLLRHAFRAFARAGCAAVTLTVTQSNRRALEFYERRGFDSIASFPAFVWERV